MHNDSRTTLELLEAVIGLRSARRLYRGELAPLFTERTGADPSQRRLAAAHELVLRRLKEALAVGPPLQSPSAVADYLKVLFLAREYESFVVLFLDGQHRFIAVEELFWGTLTQTAVYPREIVKRALYWNAGAVVFAHNHPSGVAEPSRADELLTTTLKAALALVDVTVLDHLVVAGNTAISFAERGLV